MVERVLARAGSGLMEQAVVDMGMVEQERVAAGMAGMVLV